MSPFKSIQWWIKKQSSKNNSSTSHFSYPILRPKPHFLWCYLWDPNQGTFQSCVANIENSYSSIHCLSLLPTRPQAEPTEAHCKLSTNFEGQKTNIPVFFHPVSPKLCSSHTILEIPSIHWPLTIWILFPHHCNFLAALKDESAFFVLPKFSKSFRVRPLVSGSVCTMDSSSCFKSGGRASVSSPAAMYLQQKSSI